MDVHQNSFERAISKMNKLIQTFNDLKFRTKLMILLGIVGLVPVALLGATISINAHNTVVENRKTDMRNSLQNATATVVSQAAACEQMMDYFVYEQSVINFLQCDPANTEERNTYYDQIASTIQAMEFQNLVMREIVIYSETVPKAFGSEVQPLSELEEKEWYWDVQNSEGKKFSWIFDDKNLSMLVVCEMPKFGGAQSYLAVTCNIQSLLQSYEQLAVEKNGIHIENRDEIWNYYGDKNSVYREKNANQFLTVQGKIEKLGLNAIYYTPKNAIDSLSWTTLVNILIRIFVCVVIILLLGRFFSNYISKPIELLTKDIRSVDSDNMEVGITSDRKDEIGSLIRSYNHMMRRIQELIQENYQTKIAQREFEMKALQAQINPHFLYNSLSMINWKAIEADELEISRLTLTLSSFYRTTLNRGRTMNTIKNAVENIRAYLDIQLCMHDNNFIVHYDIDEDTFEYYIPALIFQPFVENSLEHGLDIKEDPDHQMWITIGQNEKDILIAIADNGVGISDEDQRAILDYDAKGYGVKNVNDRLKIHYGEEYQITIESIPNVRTCFSIHIPKPVKGD